MKPQRGPQMAVEEAMEVVVVAAGHWKVARCCSEELLLDLMLSLSMLTCPAEMAVALEAELAWIVRVWRLVLGVADCQLEAMEAVVGVGQKWAAPSAVLALVVAGLEAHSALELGLVVAVVLEQAAWAAGLLAKIWPLARQALVEDLG